MHNHCCTGSTLQSSSASQVDKRQGLPIGAVAGTIDDRTDVTTDMCGAISEAIPIERVAGAQSALLHMGRAFDPRNAASTDTGRVHDPIHEDAIGHPLLLPTRDDYIHRRHQTGIHGTTGAASHFRERELVPA